MKKVRQILKERKYNKGRRILSLIVAFFYTEQIKVGLISMTRLSDMMLTFSVVEWNRTRERDAVFVLFCRVKLVCVTKGFVSKARMNTR